MGGHTQKQWEGKFFRCQACCWYCRVPLVLVADGMTLGATKDHLVPISRGGSDAISNIVPACIDCNRLKGSLTEYEFQKQRKRKLFTEPQGIPSVLFVEPNRQPEDTEMLKTVTLERATSSWWRR